MSKELQASPAAAMDMLASQGDPSNPPSSPYALTKTAHSPRDFKAAINSLQVLIVPLANTFMRNNSSPSRRVNEIVMAARRMIDSVRPTFDVLRSNEIACIRNR